ncbi:hypothetical protein Salat_1723800 [Sesamum alatum]|uniref:Uncharacterized protein n=1 Tax=Sesamum alatum TaxID=300844 RepID=A0AAE2CKH4_9LAMI|nr:hypothetical protein Salat_1723800 [Sesamum alatum]
MTVVRASPSYLPAVFLCLLAAVLTAAAGRSLVLAEQVTNCCFREGRFCTVLLHTSGCVPAFVGRFLSELQAFLTVVQCRCLCLALPRFQQPVAGFLATDRTGLFLSQHRGCFGPDLGLFFAAVVTFSQPESSCYTLSFFSLFRLVPPDDFSWCWVTSAATQEDFQLFLKVPTTADGRFSWLWANKNQPIARREELRVCTVFSAFSGQFFSVGGEGIFCCERFPPSHRSQAAASMLDFAKQPAGRTGSTVGRGSTFYCRPIFLVLVEQGVFPVFSGSISAHKHPVFRAVSLTSGHFPTARRIFDWLHLSLSRPAYLVQPVLGVLGPATACSAAAMAGLSSFASAACTSSCKLYFRCCTRPFQGRHPSE